MNTINQRRTFAIISHPDAGKTTLTEKLLLFGGAIQLAGAVKAKGDRRRARSDWMAIEKQRGISVSASVMTFDYNNYTFNLLDTPGHEDFSEDTYRTLTAVDSAVMVLDGAKGIETQTRKLFEVCRLRDIPIITFINKFDRECRDPLELLDEIEQSLALDATPVSWPVGMGQDFRGCYDLLDDRLLLFNKSSAEKPTDVIACQGLDDPKLAAYLPEYHLHKLRDDINLARAACPPFDRESYLAGHLTPVYFGSAVNNFGVQELLDGLGTFAPAPRPQPAASRVVQPTEPNVSGFVFKIQANMDPKHRDRVAYVRLCSGQFKRGMKLTHVRTGKQLAVFNPMLFLAQDRELAEEAFAGDIIGLPNHGNLRIGDSLSEGEPLQFSGVPSFAPELLQKVRTNDPLKLKHLRKALEQLAEEGASQVFKPADGGDWIVGVVGSLQFDVLKERIQLEYGISARFEATATLTARWVYEKQAGELKRFADANRSCVGEDHDGITVFLARNTWHLETTIKEWPHLTFLAIREQHAA